MHLLITDSGVGGLSVCASAERFLRTHAVEERFRLTYVNASRENDFGYNSMGSKREKLEHFDRFLGIIDETYSPDSIYIACNTLSVLFPDTDFSKNGLVPVRGIVETGVHRLIQELTKSTPSSVTIFGTPTTIDEAAYPNLLQQHGIDPSSIVSQACPSLADTISEDLEGLQARRKIALYVGESLAKLTPSGARHFTYLACTHYGYRKDFFSSAFRDHGFDTNLLNPNEFVVEDLFCDIDEKTVDRTKENDVDVEFVTRYRIPQTALETIAFFLDEVSPKTMRAFRDATYAPDLF